MPCNIEQSLRSLSLYTNENALHTVFQEFFCFSGWMVADF